MSELRSIWGTQEVEENLGLANESLPEAPTIDRFPTQGRAAGMDLQSGEGQYEEAPADDSDGVFQVPQDPPQRLTDEDGR